jgi:outer membrane lipopolysaccharide assembly protein LptE/RlpB
MESYVRTGEENRRPAACGSRRPASRFSDQFLKSLRFGVVLLVVAMVTAACGYRFGGGGDLPGGAQQVFVAVLENRSAETGLEALMTNDLIYEMMRTRPDSYTSERPMADAVMTGTIRETRTISVARLSNQASLRRRVTAYVDLQLTNRQGEVVWKVRRLSAKQEYDVVKDSAVTEQNRQKALKSMSSKFAEKVVIRLTEAF